MPDTKKSPFDAVRDAFAELDASEKTAFVLEATFAAVGEGLAETGRRFSDAVNDIDGLFTADRRKADAHEAAEGAPAPGSTAKGGRKKTGTTPGTTAKPKAKTAGKAKRKPTPPDSGTDTETDA